MRESSGIIEQRDDRADAIAAIEDAHAYLAPSGPRDRRQNGRIRRKVATQMVPWSMGVAPVPFGVVIEDISESGIGILHTEPIHPGRRYRLTVPRALMGSVVVECTVVRCEQRGQKLYKIGLSSATPIEHVEKTRASMTLTSPRTKLLFLAFGIVGLAIAAFWPM
jgi:hypothetical protein